MNATVATEAPRLTVEILKSLGACRDGIEDFAKEWPNGAEVTVENVLRAMELEMDFDWFVDDALPLEAVKEFDTRTDEAWDLRQSMVVPAREEWRRVLKAWKSTPAPGESTREIDGVYASLHKVAASADTEYDRAKAGILVDVIRKYGWKDGIR